MRLARASFLVLLTAALLPAQMKLTVNQLMAFIESSIRLKHEDRRVAEYLRKVRLSERLDDRNIEVLQGLGAGPKTVEALRLIAEASLTLPKAAPPQEKPAPPSIPPPSAAEQKEVIENARQYALGYTKRLPDFICVQVTRRYMDPSGLELWQNLDTITERLSYFEQKEDYKVILVNSRPVDISHDQLGGSTSSGEFGSMLLQIFEPGTEAQFKWERWATLRGRRNHVYTYRVRQDRSKYTIWYEKRLSIVPAYRGLVYVDANTYSVTRILFEAIDIPPTFPVQQAKTQLDYDYTKIGETEHVLPLRAEVRMRDGRTLSKNEVEFRLYRKFGAEATIKFDTPDPLPEEMTREQPAVPGTKPPR
ncbi:MAG: hypothetical protein SFV51_23855 [Bryobacteraceae bacterium]|nr:hypothetical protein [Bryobacteraceae bacterium]